MFELTKKFGIDALLGGWFLGGGGGGLPGGGEKTLTEALDIGSVHFVSVEELGENDEIATVSLVGSPVSKDSCIERRHYEQVYRKFRDAYAGELAALTTNEAGAQSISNGWITAAITGLPMLDGACNGRAHPTGLMGSMGLDQIPDYRALQACAGGDGIRETSLTAIGTVQNTSALVRHAATMAGGFVTVLRNPVTAAYYKENAALGTVTQAAEIGRLWRENDRDGDTLLRALAHVLDCRVLAQGSVAHLELRVAGGFDVGRFSVRAGNDVLETEFMNEYLLAELRGVRLATFPELIAVIDLASRRPVCSAQLAEGMDVAVVAVPAKRLTLGRGMHIPQLYEVCEHALGKPLCAYAFK